MTAVRTFKHILCACELLRFQVRESFSKLSEKVFKDFTERTLEAKAASSNQRAEMQICRMPLRGFGKLDNIGEIICLPTLAWRVVKSR